MDKGYLNRVLIYLQQELPDYREALTLKSGKLIFMVPDGAVFQTWYEAVFAAVSSSVNRIRNREYDLDFSVCSSNQERDFKILK